ncbi:MAG TPA: glycosyltransferase family 1 protein [Devosiaceae bacterium]
MDSPSCRERPKGTKPARVSIPLYFIRHGAVGGVENAAYNLVRGLAETGAEVTLHARERRRLAADFADFCDREPNVELRCRGRFPPPLQQLSDTRYGRFFEEYAFARTEAGSQDLTVFPNYFVPPGGSRHLGLRVGIVHDLQHRHLPQYFPAAKRAWLELALRSTFQNADFVVFISNASLEDARRYYPQYAGDHWVVIPNAVSWEDFGEPDPESPFAFPYILSVAHHFPHKNLETLLKAFALVRHRLPDHRLVLTGQVKSSFTRSSAGHGVDLGGLVAELGIADHVVITGFVSRKRLGTLYTHASCFAFPSVFEGFGLPPIEALGFGIPTIVSDIPVMAEVTMGLATRVMDYLSPSAWAEALLQVLSSAVPAETGQHTMRQTYSPAGIAARLGALAAA